MKKKISSSLHMVMYIMVMWFGTYFVINCAVPGLLRLPIYNGDGRVIGQHMLVGVKLMDGYGVTDTEFTRYVEKALKWKYGEEFVATQYATGGYEMEWNVRAYPVSNPDIRVTVYEVSEFYRCADSYYAVIHHDELCDMVYNHISSYGVEQENFEANMNATYSYAAKAVVEDRIQGYMEVVLYVQDDAEAKILEESVDGMMDTILEAFPKVDGIQVYISDKRLQSENSNERYYNYYYHDARYER